MWSLASFANILFAWKCNAFCPDCIGKQVDVALNKNNLTLWPLHNLDEFVAILQEHKVKEVSFTGTITDPMLYQHQERLIDYLRRQVDWIRLSLHTNGRLATKNIDIFNLYDRASVSMPSFDEEIYRFIMGTGWVPKLEHILSKSKIPIKVSTLIHPLNRSTMSNFVRQCEEKWVKRLVLRRLYGEKKSIDNLINLHDLDLCEKGSFMNNRVVKYHDMEITFWEFENTQNKCFNLFADGTISDEYLIAKPQSLV